VCAGQANYGFANAAVDTLALCRKQSGLPALAIQWGPIADVGFVAEVMKVGHGETSRLPFHRKSCMQRVYCRSGVGGRGHEGVGHPDVQSTLPIWHAKQSYRDISQVPDSCILTRQSGGFALQPLKTC
jgi:hypothetical protein